MIDKSFAAVKSTGIADTQRKGRSPLFDFIGYIV